MHFKTRVSMPKGLKVVVVLAIKYTKLKLKSNWENHSLALDLEDQLLPSKPCNLPMESYLLQPTR